MRLFTGIDLPEQVRERLERLLMHLRPAAHLKWSAVYNLHLTLKFIGEWPEEKLTELEGLGWFPNPHHPRVFWVGLQAGENLTALVRDTEEALAPLGVAKDDRAFAPHLTLARIKDPVPLEPLRKAIALLESTEFGSFPADRFHLYRSQPGSAGSIYTKLSEYRFQAE